VCPTSPALLPYGSGGTLDQAPTTPPQVAGVGQTGIFFLPKPIFFVNYNFSRLDYRSRLQRSQATSFPQKVRFLLKTRFFSSLSDSPGFLSPLFSAPLSETVPCGTSPFFSTPVQQSEFLLCTQDFWWGDYLSFSRRPSSFTILTENPLSTKLRMDGRLAVTNLTFSAKFLSSWVF